MKFTYLSAIMVSLILLSTAACTAASAGSAGKGTQEIAITASNEFDKNEHIQKQVEVARGSTFSVTLVSNATTGFSWNENADIADTGIVKQLKHQFNEPGSSALGAAGTEEWTFEAVSAGTTTVHMEYGRPWEGGEKGVWTFDLTVTVK